MFLVATASLGDLPDREARTIVRICLVIVMVVWIIVSSVFPIIKIDKLQNPDMI